MARGARYTGRQRDGSAGSGALAGLAGLVLAFASSPRLPARAELEITEIDAGGGSEWIELHNRSGRAVLLDGYIIEARGPGGDTAAVVPLPEGRTLEPGAYLVLCFVDSEDGGIPCSDPCPERCCDTCAPGNLDRDGGTVTLSYRSDCRSAHEPVDEIRYPPLGPRSGATYGRTSAGMECLLEGATPAAPSPACRTNDRRVLINEVYTADGAGECDDLLLAPICPDWVELYLPGADPEPVDLSAYVLESGGESAQLPAVVLDRERRFALFLLYPAALPGPFPSLPFGLRRSGDGVVLRSLDESSFDHVLIPELEAGASYARVPDGEGFAVTSAPTPALPNRAGERGVPPQVEVVDRFPLRVLPGDAIEVLARVEDIDGDLDAASVRIVWRPGPAPGAPCPPSRARCCEPVAVPREVPGCGTVESGDGTDYACPMGPGELPKCDGDPEPGIFAGNIPAFETTGMLAFRVIAEDERGNRAESELYEIRVQPRGWQDPNPSHPTHALRINEVAPRGADGDWVEIVNISDDPVLLSGMTLTDSVLRTASRELPPGTAIAARGFLQVVLDDRSIPDPTRPHLPFRLDACRDEVVLFHSDGCTVLDSMEVKETKANRTFGRVPDGGDFLVIMPPTPAGANELVTCFELAPPHAPVVINEVLADNRETLADAGGESGDWIELFNRSGAGVALDGWALRDLGGDEAAKVWMFPPGACIGADERLLLWCDNDECENDACDPVAGGPCCLDGREIHTSFEINRLREHVQLVDPQGRVADCLSLAFQARDVSMGRFPDGSSELAFLSPTPDAANAPHLAAPASFLPSCADVDRRFFDGGADPCGPPPPPRFQRGDTTNDCAVDLSDAIATLFWLFLGSDAPACIDAADADDSGTVLISDPIIVLEWLFIGTTAPAPPGPFVPGEDPTPDALPDCRANPRCLDP